MDNDNKDKGFIQEVVKEKSKKRSFLIKSILVVIVAAIAAFVAAFVFVFTVPLAKNAAGIDKETPSKIEIPGDEQKETITPTPTLTPTPTPVPEERPEIDPVIVYPEVGLTEYKKIYDDMKKAAEPVQKSIVNVTGITSQTDYFNATYENEQKTTGVIIGLNESSLYIATDYSILENVERIQVELNGGALVDAVYQNRDEDTGIAIVKVAVKDISEEDMNRIEVAKLGNSYNVSKGDPIIALGNPMGYSDYISNGMITSISNKVSVFDGQYTVFTTNISGSTAGNGVIANLDGEIIGIIISGVHDISQNTINAYSVSQIKYVLEKLSNSEARPLLGVKGSDVSAQISERTGIPRGMIITEVKDGSPAMLAGLTVNDVIVKMDSAEISDTVDYTNYMRNLQPGKKVKVTAMRKGAEGYIEVGFDIALGEK